MPKYDVVEHIEFGALDEGGEPYVSLTFTPLSGARRFGVLMKPELARRLGEAVELGARTAEQGAKERRRG